MITVTNLNKSYGGDSILENVSLADGIICEAIYSRTKENALPLAEKFKIPKIEKIEL